MALTRLTKIDGGGISTTSDYRVGVITATKFVGPIEAENATFAGNVSIGGTLTYEDVTNIDSVGLITARDGIKVGAGVTILSNGRAEFTGFTTFAQGLEIPFYKSLNIGNSLYGKIFYPTGGSSLVMQALNQLTFKCWTGNYFATGLYLNGISGLTRLGGYNMGNNSSIAPQLDVTGHTTQSITMKSSDGTNLTERFRLSQSGFNFTGLSTHTGNFDLDGDLTVGTGVTIETNGNSNFVGVSSLGTGATGAVYLYNPDADALSATTNDDYGWKAKTYTQGLQVNSTLYLSRSGSNGLGLSYNNATGSYITAESGFLRVGVPYGSYFNLYANDVYIKDRLQTKNYAHFQKVSGTEYKVNLYGGNNVVKLTTEESGVNIVGTTTTTQLAVTGVSTFASSIKLNNSVRINFGNSSNSYIYYDSGGTTHFQTTGGNLAIASNIGNTFKYMISAIPNNKVSLYYSGDEKIQTTSTGIKVGTGVTVETNGQANFSGISTFHTGIYIKEANNYSTVQTHGQPNLDMPFVLNVQGGGSTGIGTALFTGGYGTRPEVVFEQRHGGNFVNSYPHTYPWKIKWTLPNDNDTTDDQVLIQNSIGVGGNFSSFQVKTTDNSTGLRNTLDLSSTSSTLWVDNNVALRVNSDGVNIPNWIVHHMDSDTKIGFSQNDKIQLQAGGTTRIQTTSIGAQIDTTLLLYGPAGNPGRLRLQEGGALSEIRVARNSDNNSFLFFDTEISGSTSTRVVIDESGHFRPWVDSTYDLGITGTRWRNVYADTYYGDGSNLTGVDATTVKDSSGNVRVLGTPTGAVVTGILTATASLNVKQTGNAYLNLLSTGTGNAGIYMDASNGDIAGSDYCFIGQQNDLNFVIQANSNAGHIDFKRGSDIDARIDTSGRLLIGTTTEGHSNAGNLTVSDSGAAGITIRSTGNNCHIYFSDATSGAGEYVGQIAYNHSSDYMNFITNGSERLRIDSSGGMKQTSTEAFQIAKGTTAERPSSPVVGMLRFNTTTDLLENYNSNGWSAVNVKIPVITSITGEIYAGLPSNLTINGTDFTSTVSITFKEGSTTRGTLTNQSVSSGSVTVSVPSGVYNQSAGDTITIILTNSDGVASGGTNKTVQATPSGGNSITTSGDYRIHTFTSSGTFSTPSGWSSSYDYVVVAGGGSGGNNKQGGYENGGGGGAGGMLTGSSSLAASTNYSISIGGGGARPGGDGQTRGGNTTAFGLTAIGGGGGRTRDTGLGNCNGGSGGGTTNWDDVNSPGSGTSGQGNRGGYATQVGNPQGGSGGGGGKGAVGGGGSGTTGASGGSGGSTSIRGSSETFAGGGGGGGGSGGSGGSGGGGQAGNSNSINGSNGSSNTGGGGGGNYAPDGNAGNGGSGIVIVRYKKT